MCKIHGYATSPNTIFTLVLASKRLTLRGCHLHCCHCDSHETEKGVIHQKFWKLFKENGKSFQIET